MNTFISSDKISYQKFMEKNKNIPFVLIIIKWFLSEESIHREKSVIQQINKLCHHFETVLDSDRCKNQFLQFKHLVRCYRAMNFEQFTSSLIQEYKHVHPDFVQLALISLVIPVASAPCEWGFSVQNSINLLAEKQT